MCWADGSTTTITKEDLSQKGYSDFSTEHPIDPQVRTTGHCLAWQHQEFHPSMRFVLSLPFGGRCSHSSSPLRWLHAGTSSAVPEEVKICNFPLLLLIKCQHSGNLQELLFPLSPLGPRKALLFFPCSQFT